MEIHTASHFPKTHRTYYWLLEDEFFSAFAMYEFDFEDIFMFGDSRELSEGGDPEYAVKAWVKLTFR